MSSQFSTAPTKLQRLRNASARLLTDESVQLDGTTIAPVWEESAVITERQTDIWREVAVAVSAATHGCVCVIEDKEGDGSEEDGLEMDLTIAVTILGPVNLTPGAEPEELLWEKTVRRLHNARPICEGVTDDWSRRLRFQGWKSAPDMIPDSALEAVQLARQTVFKVRFSLDPDA